MALAIASSTGAAGAAELPLRYLSCLDRALPDNDRLVRVAVSDDGHFVAAASAYGSTVSLWHLTSNVDWPFRCSVANALDHGSRWTHIDDLAFSPDGKNLATAASDDKVRIWNVAAPQQPMKTISIPGHPQAIAFAPDGGSLAIAAWDGSVSLWMPQSGGMLQIAKPTDKVVWRISFVNNGQGLIWADSRSIHTLNLSTMMQKDSPFAVDFNDKEWSPYRDGSMVIGREGGVGINLWGSVDGKQRLKTIEGQFYTIMFFADSRRIAVLDQDGMKIWDMLDVMASDVIEIPTLLAVTSIPIKNASPPRSVAYKIEQLFSMSSSGTYIVTGDNDDSIIVIWANENLAPQ